MHKNCPLETCHFLDEAHTGEYYTGMNACDKRMYQLENVVHQLQNKVARLGELGFTYKKFKFTIVSLIQNPITQTPTNCTDFF